MEIEKIFARSFPGFLSIRDSKHKITYLNDNFKNWIKLYTDVDPIGKTNDDLMKLVEKNVASVFEKCHDVSLDFIKNCDSTKSLKKIIPFNQPGEKTQYFEVIKYGQKIDCEDHILTVCFDITELYLENEKNLTASLLDCLTNCYNRNYFKDKSPDFFGDKTFFCVDLDNFKLINDNYGHGIGDDVLVKFIDILNESIRKKDEIVRLGGDEFLIIFNKLEVKKCELILDRIKYRFHEVFKTFPELSFSYGGCRFFNTIEETIEKADSIMYNKKFLDKEIVLKKEKYNY